MCKWEEGTLVDCLIALENYINKHKETQSDLINKIQKIKFDIFMYFQRLPELLITQLHKSPIKDVKLKLHVPHPTLSHILEHLIYNEKLFDKENKVSFNKIKQRIKELYNKNKEILY